MDMLNNKWYKEVTQNDLAAQVGLAPIKPIGGALEYIVLDKQVPAMMLKAEVEWLLSNVKKFEGIRPFFLKIDASTNKVLHSGSTWEEVKFADAIAFKFYTEFDIDKLDAVAIVKTEEDWFYLTSFRCRYDSSNRTLQVLWTGNIHNRVAYRAFRCDDFLGLKKLLQDLDWVKSSI